MQSGKPLLIIAEDVEGEALVDARREQDPRHVPVGRRQGPRLRRPPQGDAAGHRHPHRRPGHLRGGRPQARERRPSTCSAGPARSSSPRTRRRSSRVPATPSRSPAGSTRSAPRSRSRTPTTTARSSRSASPSWPAASPSSRPARPPRSSSRSASTASRTPSATPRRPSRRASSPVVAWRCIQAGPRAFEKLELDGRRGDRREHRARRPRGPAQADRDQRRPRGRRRGREGARPPARPRPQRRDRRVRRPDPGRHHRPGQGDPLGAAERRRRSRRCSSPPRPSSPTSPRRPLRPAPGGATWAVAWTSDPAVRAAGSGRPAPAGRGGSLTRGAAPSFVYASSRGLAAGALRCSRARPGGTERPPRWGGR